MIRILTLNLWNYNNFKKRKPIIIKFIKKYNPDIVAFQEVRDDLRFNSKGNNQAKQLNKELKYPFLSFVKTMDINAIDNTLSNPPCFGGLAILSKFPIIKVVKKRLKQHPDDKFTRAVLYAKIKMKKIVNVFVVHYSLFGFNDLFAKLHFEETLQLAKKNRIKPIIIGDFNIKNPKIINKLALNDYFISRNIKRCISHPPTKSTVDYILIPKIYKFKSFICAGAKISDHKALVGDIII